MTSLFIAIFLFFLSVALIWTNRQDIALSLSMEHKLKAQSAARTGAHEAFARLRRFGELGAYRGGALPGGSEVKVELVSLDALGKRGPVMLLRSRGTSGPVSSYLTLHLLDVRIAGKGNEKEHRVLFFPGPSSASSAESGSEASASSSANKALFGDFVLREGGPGVSDSMVANGGPVFLKEELETSYPPSFQDFLPVFSPDLISLTAWGPTLVVAPKWPTEPGRKITALRWVDFSGDEFEQKEIDPPDKLGDPEPDPSLMTGGVFEMEAPLNSTWTTGSIFGVGPDNVRDRIWTEEKPPTVSVEGSVFSGPPTEAGPTIDWSSAGSVETQQKFATTGAIYASGKSVYTHGWHYVYQHYKGSVPSSLTPLNGALLTRWPCILKYTVGGTWSKAWTPLQQDGSVQTEFRPDTDVLLADSQGTLYSTLAEGGPRRLLTIQSGTSVKVGKDPLPEGNLILYQDRPYIVTANPVKPIQSLLDDKFIDFSTLPSTLPEIQGEVVDVTGTETVVLGQEGGNAGQPLDSGKRLRYTARPRYDFSYTMTPGALVAVDDDDLWAVIHIETIISDPTYEKGYDNPPYSDSPRTALARYDGERWHILPDGLRARLKETSLSAPAKGVVAAIYDQLPAQINRYAVISVDTNPFEFGQ